MDFQPGYYNISTLLLHTKRKNWVEFNPKVLDTSARAILIILMTYHDVLFDNWDSKG